MRNNKKLKKILQGPQDLSTNLWKINLPRTVKTQQHTTSKGENFAFNLETLTSQQDIIHSLHAELFSPEKST